MAEDKKKKKDKTDKDRAKALGWGMAKKAGDATIERKKKQRAIMKKLKLD